MKQALFTKEKTTRNMVRYREDSEIPIIGTLYVTKHFLAACVGGTDYPEKVRLTLEVVDENSHRGS